MDRKTDLVTSEKRQRYSRSEVALHVTRVMPRVGPSSHSSCLDSLLPVDLLGYTVLDSCLSSSNNVGCSQSLDSLPMDSVD